MFCFGYIRWRQSGDSSGSVTISPFSTSGMLSQLLSLYPVSYFALIVLTKESNNTKSSHTLFDWRILMFFIYHCKTKDNFITFFFHFKQEVYLNNKTLDLKGKLSRIILFKSNLSLLKDRLPYT